MNQIKQYTNESQPDKTRIILASRPQGWRRERTPCCFAYNTNKRMAVLLAQLVEHWLSTAVSQVCSPVVPCVWSLMVVVLGSLIHTRVLPPAVKTTYFHKRWTMLMDSPLWCKVCVLCRSSC